MKMKEAHGEILRLGAGGVQARAEQRAAGVDFVEHLPVAPSVVVAAIVDNAQLVRELSLCEPGDDP